MQPPTKRPDAHRTHSMLHAGFLTLCVGFLLWPVWLPSQASAKPRYTAVGPDQAALSCDQAPIAKSCMIPKKTNRQQRRCDKAQRALYPRWLKACRSHFHKQLCSQRRLDTRCCRGRTPGCASCRKAAELWRRAKREACANMPQRNFTINCSKPPRVICCQAMIPSCLRCKRRARELRRRWRRRCQPRKTPPRRGIDCSKRPNIACCQAMTRGCLACKRRARDAYKRWRRACKGKQKP